MHIVNIHKRNYKVPKDQFMALFSTLASKEDKIWPKEKWPSMKLDNGLNEGSKGGHGPIRYFVRAHIPGEKLVFQFTKPIGFDGVHKFDIEELEKDQIKVIHTIDMKTDLIGSFLWYIGIKWLHDALIEDGLDKIHNVITGQNESTPWNIWVHILRAVLK